MRGQTIVLELNILHQLFVPRIELVQMLLNLADFFVLGPIIARFVVLWVVYMVTIPIFFVLGVFINLENDRYDIRVI